ncbi:helix-turn-helix domain-containing protein [Sphingomonas sp. BAUL-RG-20F-R05-02]|uniref:helix-turn-helix domain-containing protein n=1 Tax=Sphingomonas sp. BAUL-RG-20F-R05-02 TaxID=2914830 RepID=UPI001F58B7DF|nr:helix-turn-helix domain-containing protein [Sphingomonas sp. BAUL-RG-20F-R05-02]
MTLGMRIEKRRREVGISQAELARRVGVSQSTINSLINSDSRSSRSLHKIARELETTAAFLAGETDDPSCDAPITRQLSASAREMLDCFEILPGEEQREVLQITRRLAGRRAPNQPVTLPSTAALTDAMAAFFEASPGLTADELAHELAMSLPIILRAAADEIVAPQSGRLDTDLAPQAAKHVGRRAGRTGPRN